MVGHGNSDVSTVVELRDFDSFFLFECRWRCLIHLANDVDDFSLN